MAVAHSYRRLGIGAGDRVVCQFPNRPNHVVAMVAAWVVGAIHVGADPELTPRELGDLVDRTQPVAVVIEGSPASAERAAALGTAQSRPRVICADGGSGELNTVDDLVALGSGAAAMEIIRGPEPDDVAVIFFTSGTTGTPKGVFHRHRLMADGWRSTAEMLRFTEFDVHLGHLPLTHAFGTNVAMLALSSGGCLVLLERFSPEAALRLIGTHGVTVLHGTPTHFTILTDRLDLSRHRVDTLRVGMGTAAAFPPHLLRRIFDDLGMRLYLMYGSSELVSVGTADPEVMLRGSVGRLEDRSWVRIVGPDRKTLADGQLGTVAFKVAAPMRYWGEQVSDEGFDGWYYTSDLGRFDDQGYLYVLGRLNQQVNRGGIKVDPGEVEARLLQHPAVADAAVVGTPHPVLGEAVCACVVNADGAEVPTLSGIREFLADSLAKYKLPDELCVITSVPRNKIGKVDRASLRELASADESRQRLRPLDKR
jgi:acyl-CoA synthetase (AMP-forming)/AMP-acid ligase II